MILFQLDKMELRTAQSAAMPQLANLMLVPLLVCALEVSASCIVSTNKSENYEQFRKLVSSEVHFWIFEGMRGLRSAPETWCGYIDTLPLLTDQELAELEQSMDKTSVPDEKIPKLLKKISADRERRLLAREECELVAESILRKASE